MYIKKTYGMSKTINCPFCGKTALTENSQGVPVCISHKKELMPDMKCICGGWLDIRKGKFGPYFSCFKCGNVNWNKALEANPNFLKEKASSPAPEKPVNTMTNRTPNKTFEKKTFRRQSKACKTYKAVSQTKTETVITSDELDFYY